MVSGSSGGFLANYPLNLTPGEVIPITIGDAAGSGYQVAGHGGTTSFGSYLACSGGSSNSNPGNSFLTPGSCNVGNGTGLLGEFVVLAGGAVTGGQTPIGFGTGGFVWRCYGCASPNPTIGYPGQSGGVIVDVLY